jgi:tRNA (guanine-N7-)-methyltransferase
MLESKHSLKGLETDYSYRPDFKYSKSSNPYHDRLEIFDDFVLRDAESEKYQGNWGKEVFKNQNPIHAEIGTGFGHFMHEYCQSNPDINFVGMDYRFKRSYHLAKRLAELKTSNFKYLRGKGERLEFIFGENELESLFYFFPDPWPKSRHHKKRLFQKPFLDACYKTLRPGGILYVKTDHDGYFDWMLEKLEGEKRFEVLLQTRDLHKDHSEHFLAKYITKFEKIFLQKEINIKAVVLKSLK